MFQRLQPSEREYCDRCGEYCEPDEDAIRTEHASPTSGRVYPHWWHVECHAAELVSLVEQTRDRATWLGVTIGALAAIGEPPSWTPKREMGLSPFDVCAMRDRVSA